MTELHTKVDDLMELVRKEEKVSVADAAKKLGISEKALQNWVDFLVEEHVLGIEYKFTTPYIYVHSEDRLKAIQEEEENLDLEDFRKAFYEYARDKDMPEQKLPQLWRQHLRYVVENQHKYFLEEAKRRGIEDQEALYQRYTEELFSGT